MKHLTELARSLCELRGISGDEARVREFIAGELQDGSTRLSMKTDPLGNLIVAKPGQAPGKKIVLFAHMDEVGLIVSYLTDGGLLKFHPIGIDPLVLHGRRVRVGEGGVPGVIGAKVWHHLDSSERDAALKSEGLAIDIGAATREEAAAVVSPGDAVTFDEPFCEFGEGMLLSRALDNRLGCVLLMRLLLSDCPWELTGVFTTGEESGLSGATAAAYATAPEISVILETTTASDVDGAPADKVVCSLGHGPVVSFADKGTLYDRGLFSLAFDTAKRLEIPVQTKEGVYGGNEARAVSRAGAGSRTLALSVPCRYLHSGSTVAALRDLENAERLLLALIGPLAAL